MGKMKEIYQSMKDDDWKGTAEEYLKWWLKKQAEQIDNAGKVVDNYEQYSNVMIDMLYDKKYYDKCASNSIKRYEEVYKLETVIKKYIDIYKEVANA